MPSRQPRGGLAWNAAPMMRTTSGDGAWGRVPTGKPPGSMHSAWPKGTCAASSSPCRAASHRCATPPAPAWTACCSMRKSCARNTGSKSSSLGWGYEQHWCEIVLQRPREAYQRMPGYDSLVAVTRAREFQRAGEALLQKLEEGLQEPAQDKAD